MAFDKEIETDEPQGGRDEGFVSHGRMSARFDRRLGACL